MTDTSEPAKPYKYVDFYREEDASIFFGRRREIETLLADIVDTRLVVLFAKTGSGKSSLINAGVRPRLEKLRYRTVVARVGRDAPASVRSALIAEGVLPPNEPWMPFARMLMHVAQLHQQPLVVFIDQFEEFFVSPMIDRPLFIMEVGTLSRTPKSGVHLVFSMREDYLADMDMFRDEIPTIFQKESQLRLRAFPPEQAKEAIEGPSRVFTPPFRYGKGLVDRIVKSLPLEDGLILPVALQIVCDTLWREAAHDVIDTATYERLGGASGILSARISEDIDTLDADSIVALEKLIPQLATRDLTKQSRTSSELVTLTGIDPGTLSLVSQKLSDLHLLRVEMRESETVIEWMSDYVAKLTSELAPTLALLWLRKMRGAGDPETLPLERIVAMLDDDLLLERLDRADWEQLLRASARSRDALGLWYAGALRGQQDIWTMIRDALDDPAISNGSAHRLMLFLGESPGEPAVDILAAQVGRRERARTALRSLGATRSPRAVQFLEPALDDPELHAAALDALQTLGRKDALALAERARRKQPQFAGPVPLLKGLDPALWNRILCAVSDNAAAVVIGPHAGTHRQKLARTIAEQFQFPFSNKDDLEAVLDYMKLTYGDGWKKMLVGFLKPLDEKAGADYEAIARLSIDLFVTTDPTDELEGALIAAGRKPQLPRSGYMAKRPQHPSVIYANGSIQQPATIGTARATWNTALIDLLHRVMTGTGDEFAPRTIIAVGFDPDDPWLDDFRHAFAGGGTLIGPDRVLPALIVTSPPPLDDHAAEARAQQYYLRQADARDVMFYWGTAQEFAAELARRRS